MLRLRLLVGEKDPHRECFWTTSRTWTWRFVPRLRVLVKDARRTGRSHRWQAVVMGAAESFR
jgi:hypothetical protein